MAANKLIQQPDILNLDSLGAFMDAQNDPIASDMGNKEQEKVKAEEQVSPDTVSEEVISSNAQSEVPKSVQEEEHPRKPKQGLVRASRSMCSPSSRLVLVNGTPCSDMQSSITTIPTRTGLPLS